MPRRMKSVLSLPATTTKAYKAIKGHKQEVKPGQDFYLSLNHGKIQRKQQQKKKIFLFPCFFLTWQNNWVSAAPFKSDYLIFRDDFAKVTAAYREAAHRMFPSPPTPKNLGGALKTCRTKAVCSSSQKKTVDKFHYPNSLLLPFSCCLPRGNYTIRKLHQSHSYYSTM